MENVSERLTRDELGKICRKIIQSYRDRDYSTIHNLYRALVFTRQEDSQPGGSELEKSQQGKRDSESPPIKQQFYYLVKLYHPDMIQKHKQNYMLAIKDQNYHVLDFYNAMMQIENLVSEPALAKETSDCSVSESYGFDADLSDFMDYEDYLHEVEFESDFIEVLKEMFFGNLDIHLEPIDLHQIDGELDVSDYDLYDIEGIEHCCNVTALNLSNNRLSNIYQLRHLTRLAELDLSDNEIFDIEPLTELDELETLYLENNDIEQFELLLKLPGLKFVSIYGNPGSADEEVVRTLKAGGVIVV